MQKMNKKGQAGVTLNSLAVVAIILVIVSVVLSVGSDILQDMQTDQTAGAGDYNATSYGMAGLGELGSWIDTIALVVAAVIIIGLLFSFFGRFAKA